MIKITVINIARLANYSQRFVFAVLLVCMSGAAFAELPKRVISLAPNVTEFLFAAGMTEQIVGVSAYSDYPNEAQLLPIVADVNGINLEKLISLKPDLVITWQGFTSKTALTQLNSLNIPVKVLSAQSLTDLGEIFKLLQPISQSPETAQDAYERFITELNRLTQKTESAKTTTKRPTVKVFVLFSSDPLITTNQTSLQGQVITLCGGKNIFADSPVAWPQANLEGIIAAQPDLLLLPSDVTQPLAYESKQLSQLLELLPKMTVIKIDANQFNRESPRLINAATELCEKLQNMRI